jgi:hypothetical protein
VHSAASERLPGRFALLALLLAVTLLFTQLPTYAQYGSAAISATVTDNSGAVVPKAKVTLKNEASNSTRDTLTNGSGLFSFVAVPPGSYTVTVTSPGFQPWEQKGIVLNQGSSVTLPNVAIQVEGTKQEVQVAAIAEVVQTDNGQTSQTLNQKMVDQLSIVGRDAAELIKIMPGMGMATGLGQNMWNSYTTASNTGPIGAFSASGTQPNGAMTMTSDGANLLDPGNQGTQTANINQNQVSEVTILTSSYGAEFAKGPVTFQAIGKSGGAQFHGGAYLYARNGVFNANDSYNKSQGAKAPQDSYYYPGGEIGGPVIIPKTNFNKNHDKLFFYTAYEYMKQSPSGSLQSRFVPTQEMMNGNFSPAYIASLGPNFANNYSAGTVTPCQNGCTQGGTAPGGIIPASQLDPNSNIMWKTYPKANVNPVTNGSGANYQFFLGPPQNRWEYRIRGDYNISDKTKLFFSWNHQNEGAQSPISVWWWTGTALPYPSSQAATQLSDVYSANLVHVFSPTLTSETIFASAKFLNPVKLGDPDLVNPTKLGFQMTGVYKNPYTPQIPNVFTWGNTVPGYFTPSYGEPWSAGGANSFGKMSQTPNIAENITKIAGNHTIKAGFYWDFARNQQTTGGYQTSTQGTAEFENYGSNSSGNPLADFAMARITQFFQAQSAPIADEKYYQYSFYGSDQWKVSRRLTVTLGVRFDHMGNWVPNSDSPGLAVWNPYVYNNTSSAGAWTGLEWTARNKDIPRSGFPSAPFFISPRAAAAWDLFGDGKTVIRGGFGSYRYQLAYNSLSGQALSDPLNVPQVGTTWDCCVGWNSFNQFSPSTGTPGLGQSISGILQMGDSRTPYTNTYNITVSHRMPWNSVAEVGYNGNHSYNMLLDGGLSQQDLIPMGAFFGTNPITGTVTLPGSPGFNPNDYYKLRNYTGVQLISHGSYANYNSMQATWQKQSGHITFTMNYTFSKLLGVRDNQTANGAGDGTTVYPYSLRANYGVQSYDHTQIFNAAYVWNLPKFVHNGNKFAEGAINGWQLSGITQMQTGAPIQPNTNGDLNVQWPSGYSAQNYLGSNAPNLHVMPKLVCDPRSNLSSGQYFNPACFTRPTGGANGDYIWPYIHGPAYFNSDLALYKNFNIKESQNIQFRFSAFNFLNHPLPQFGLSGNSDIQLNFNRNDQVTLTNQNALTSGKPLYTTGRRVVEFSLKYNF